MSTIDTLIESLIPLLKKVKIFRTKSEDLKKIISQPNHKKMILNSKHKELYDFLLSILKECTIKESNIIKIINEIIELSSITNYLPETMYEETFNCLISTFKYSTNKDINKSFIGCISTFLISQTHHMHAQQLLDTFRLMFDCTILLNIHDNSFGEDFEKLIQVIDILVMKMEMANDIIEDQKKRQSVDLSLSCSSPVVNGLLPCFEDSLSLVHLLFTFITTKWYQRESSENTFKPFVSTLANDAKENLDLKCKLYALRLISGWLNTFSSTLRESKLFRETIENESQFIQEIEECLKISATEELLFDESLVVFKSMIKHRSLFKRAINLMFHCVYIPYLRHPYTPTNMKQKILDFINYISSLNIYNELYINCECELYGENILHELVECLLYNIENESDIQFKHEFIITLEKLIKTIKQMVLDNKDEESDVNEMLQKKIRFNEIKAIFVENSRKGVEAFKKEGFCGESVKEVVEFFIKNIELDKKAIGDYLGKPDEFNREALKETIGTLDFAGKEIDKALRMMFDVFVMGGEGQVVDRVMETFGAHYYSCNKEQLEQMNLIEDHMYQLATTIIFLSTEAHNPSAKNKQMDTFEKFKDILIGGFGIQMDENLLKGIYDRTVKEAFMFPKKSFVEEINEMTKVEQNKKKMKTLFLTDVISIREFLELKMKQYEMTNYLVAQTALITKKLFEIIAVPTSKTIEKMYHQIEKNEDVKILLESLTNIIEMSCLLHHENKPEVISSLLEITKLDEVALINSKNILAIQALLLVCTKNAEYICECWENCFDTIFKFERLSNIACGWKEEKYPIIEFEDHIKRFDYESQYVYDSNAIIMTAEQIPHCVMDIKENDLGNVYNTLKLSDEAVVWFFKGLCNSAIKVLESPTPRISILQKLVISTDANIQRNEETWKKIWEHLQMFYIQCGMHPIENIAMSVLDNLRQLTSKLLMIKEETTSNQKEFLKPYVIIISDHPNINIREFVIQVLQQTLSNKSVISNLKSAWETLFEIFLFGANDDLSIKTLSFQFFKSLYKSFERCDYYDTYYFLCLRCLKVYGQKNIAEEIALQVNSLIQMMITFLVDQKESIGLTDEWYEKLLPLFKVLALNIHSSHVSVASNSMEIFFCLLRQNEKKIEKEMMEIILHQCLLPLFTTSLPQQWISNNTESLFNSTLKFLLEFDQYSSILNEIVDFAFYVIFHEGPDFSSSALTFINKYVSGISSKNMTELMGQFIIKFAKYCNTIVNYIDCHNEYQSSKSYKEKTIEHQLKGTCSKCSTEIISEYLITCPICGKKKYCSEKCYKEDTNHHKSSCLKKKHIKELKDIKSVDKESFLKTLPKNTSSIIAKLSGINNVSQTLFSLFSIIIEQLSNDQIIVIFTNLTSVYSHLFTLYQKQSEEIQSNPKSETMVKIYDMYIVQLFEMYLYIFTLDEEHRNCILNMFFNYIQGMLVSLVENKCEYTLYIPKSVIMSFFNQISKITDDVAYFLLVDFIYEIMIDLILSSDDDLRKLIHPLLLRHRKIQKK